MASFNDCCEAANENLPQLKSTELVPGQIYTVTARKIVSSPHGKTVLCVFDDAFVYFLPARFQSALMNNPDAIPVKIGEALTQLKFIHHKTLPNGKITPIFEVVKQNDT